MATPGFGFSVGDFIAGVSLVRKLIRALNDSAGASASYRQLISELFDLDEALTRVSNLHLHPAQSAQKIALEQVASQCQLSITAFIDKNAKFKGSLGVTPGQPTSTSRWQASLHKIQWALCRDSDIQALRTEIQAHTRTLNLLLSTIQIVSLNLQEKAIDTCMNLTQSTQAQTAETNALVMQNHLLLASQADQIASVARFVDSHQEDATESKDLQLLITNVMESNAKILTTVLQMQQLLSNLPPQVNRQQPIVFEDAHGRLLPMCIELINSFEVFQAVLEARFRDLPGFKKVKSLEYTVQDVAARSKIDLTKSWESIFRPGRRMNMSVVFQQSQAQSSSCPGCFSEKISVGDDTNEDIHCSNPLCGIWYRRITELDAANCDIEGKPQDESDIDDTDQIHDFRRVEILHLPITATSEKEQNIGVNSSSSGSETASSHGSMWSYEGSMWPTDTRTKMNNKHQFVTVINHKQQNRRGEPSPTYKTAKTYGTRT